MKENNNRKIKPLKLKSCINNLLTNQQTEPSTGLSSQRSGLVSDRNMGEAQTERFFRRTSSQIRKYSTNSTSHDKAILQSFINPLLNNKDYFKSKRILTSPNSIQNINSFNSNLVSPISAFNSSQNNKFDQIKQPENYSCDDLDKKFNLTKNTYHEYLHNELNDQQSKIINHDKIISIQGSQLNINLEDIKPTKPVEIINSNQIEQEQQQNVIQEVENQQQQQYQEQIQKQNPQPQFKLQLQQQLSSNHLSNKINEHFNEDTNRLFQSQNKLLDYSRSRINFPKVNPEYFVLSHQVYNNLNQIQNKRSQQSIRSSQISSIKNSGVLEDLEDTYRQTVNKVITDRCELNKIKLRQQNKHHSTDFNHDHLSSHKRINSQERQQKLSLYNSRDYFTSLFDQNDKKYNNNNKSQNIHTNIMLSNNTQIDFKAQNFKINEIKKQKLKNQQNIQNLSQQLVDKGLVESDEIPLLNKKLQIQKFFMKKDIQYQKKKDCFKKLIEEFNPQSVKYSTQDAKEMTQMLMTFKPFYLDKNNSPQIKQKLFKQQEQINPKIGYLSNQSFYNTDRGLESQATTFYQTNGKEGFNVSNKTAKTKSRKTSKFLTSKTSDQVLENFLVKQS